MGCITYLVLLLRCALVLVLVLREVVLDECVAEEMLVACIDAGKEFERLEDTLRVEELLVWLIARAEVLDFCLLGVEDVEDVKVGREEEVVESCLVDGTLEINLTSSTSFRASVESR